MNTNSSHTARPQPAKRRRARKEPEGELLLDQFVTRRKVSELQEMWGFWENEIRPPSRKAELVEPLLAALRDEDKIRSRIKVLSSRPREVLVRLMRSDDYTAGVADLVSDGNGRSLESYEVEAAARALSKRGFLQVQSGRATGRGREVYVVPKDFGDLIAALMHEEKRGPHEVFSLRGHLAAMTPMALRRVLVHAESDVDPSAPPEELAAAMLADADGDALLGRVEDETLRNALRQAVNTHGGIIPRAELDEALGDGSRWDRTKLRTLLEQAGLGTVTSLGLGDFGVDLGGETVVLFCEVCERVLDSLRPEDGPDFERLDSARVDFLTDLQQFLHLVASSPLRVTQGRTIYRAAQHRILAAFIFNEDALVNREQIFGLVYDLAFRLELVETTEESRLKLTQKGKTWDSQDLTQKVGEIYDRFLEERLPEGRDFHVRRLRRAVAHALADAPTDAMIPLNDVPFRVRNDYLASTEATGVKDLYRNRFQYVYSPPRESPEDLRQDLAEYMISRLYPLGLVEIALCTDGVPVGARLTEMGRRLLAGEKLSQPAGAEPAPDRAVPVVPLVVNPDFEVILFPEGDVNEIAHRLGRFASRTKSEEVAHYRITREGVERAVVKGMQAAEILEFLTSYSRVPVPQNVAYSIKEWAGRVSFLSQRECWVLQSSDADSMDRALAVDDVKRLLIARLSPTAAALRGKIADWKVLELLRSLGIYFK